MGHHTSWNKPGWLSRDVEQTQWAITWLGISPEGYRMVAGGDPDKVGGATGNVRIKIASAPAGRRNILQGIVAPFRTAMAKQNCKIGCL